MDSANAASAASSKSKSSLAQRLISALALLPLLIVLVWWSVWAVVVGIAVGMVIALIELYGAFRQGGYEPRVAVGVGVALAVLLAMSLQAIAAVDLVLPVVTLAIIAGLVAELPRSREAGVLPAWGLTLAGALYLSLLAGHIILLRALDTPLEGGIFAPLHLTIAPGAAWIYFVLAITWVQDTAAYFVGRALGRHKMAPVLSPKKTWEGAAGGLIGSILAGVVCVPLLGLPITLVQAGLLGLVGGVAGPLGDLSESLIKRQV